MTDQEPLRVDQPSCEKCREAPQGFTRSAKSVPRLRDQSELWAVQGGQKSTETTHFIDELLARYHLRSTVHCSLPDKTAHKDGYVVRTKCGETINIGHICGAHWIHGLGEALKADLERQQEEERLVKMATAPEWIRAGEEVASSARSLIHFTELVRTRIGSVAETMVKVAHKTLDGRLESAPRPAPEGKGRMITESYTIVGVELFDESKHPNVDGIRSQTRYLGEIHASDGYATPDDKARKVVREIDRLEKQMREATDWADVARRFFATQNMQAALVYTAERDAQVEKIRAENGRFIMPDGTTLGLDGLTTPKR